MCRPFLACRSVRFRSRFPSQALLERDAACAEVKQAALEQEMEALGQAKAVLAGSGLSFLEKRQ